MPPKKKEQKAKVDQSIDGKRQETLNKYFQPRRLTSELESAGLNLPVTPARSDREAPREKAKSPKPKQTFKPGEIQCLPDYFVVVEKETIIEARKKIREKIWECMRLLNEQASGKKEVNTFYIGKSYIDSKKDTEFKPTAPETWLTKGITDRYSDHKKKYSSEYLIVVAVVTEDSIPARNQRDESIKYPQELVLTLENRLIEGLMKEVNKRPRLRNATTNQGKKAADDKKGYVVYMTATIGDPLVTLQVDLTYSAAKKVDSHREVGTKKVKKVKETEKTKETPEQPPEEIHQETETVSEETRQTMEPGETTEDLEEPGETTEIEPEEIVEAAKTEKISEPVIAVQHNQVSITGQVDKVKTAYYTIKDKVADSEDKQFLGSLPAVLSFNVRESVCRSLPQLEDILDELMREKKLAIVKEDGNWCLIISIKSIEKNIRQMFETHEELLDRLLPSVKSESRVLQQEDSTSQQQANQEDSESRVLQQED